MRKRLAFAGFTLLVLFGVPEAFFQAREVVRARRKPRLPLEDCEHRGHRLIPGARYERTERTIEVNSFGLRGPEVTREKPAGTQRVACIGGSTTFGLYASSNDHTWPAGLERRLRAGGRAVEVLNCGAPAWTLRTSLTNLELTVFPLRPDVVVCYHGYNDLLGNTDPRYVPDSHVDDVEALRRQRPFSLLEASALFRFVKSRFRDPYDALTEKTAKLDPEGEVAFERNLRRLVRRTREEGAKLLLCTFPWAYRDTLEASRAADVPEMKQWYDAGSPFAFDVLTDGMRRYNERVRRVGQEEGVPVLDLEATFPRDVKLYVSPIHHSDEGEALVAEKVAAALVEHGLLAAP